MASKDGDRWLRRVSTGWGVLAAAGAFGFLAATVGAQAPAPTPPAETRPPASQDDAAPPALPLPDADDDVFVPSEELPADEEVTFPVDI